MPIPGFPGYHIDRTGRVWSAHRKGRIPRGACSRWLDRREWTLRHGTMHCGDRSHLARLTDHQCSRILDCLGAGFSRREVAAAFGVTVSHVAALKTGRIRKHLTNQHV